MNDESCQCKQCAEIHKEFIMNVGRWPVMSHDDAQALQRRRDESEQAWAVMLDE
jgi:hypothetical protein